MIARIGLNLRSLTTLSNDSITGSQTIAQWDVRVDCMGAVLKKKENMSVVTSQVSETCSSDGGQYFVCLIAHYNNQSIIACM